MTEVILPEEAGVSQAEGTFQKPDQVSISFSEFAALYGESSEFSGPDTIRKLFDLMREDKVVVDFSVPGVRITCK